jgi:hypothetical protein
MPPLSSQLRQIEIINRLKKGSADYDTILKYFEKCIQLSDKELKFGKRTFLRDIKEIEIAHGIKIKCDKRTNLYTIEEVDLTNRNQLLFDSYQAFSIINTNKSLLEYVSFEPRVSQGKEHFQTILKAIHESKKLTFLYQRWQEDSQKEEKICEPYLLKEHEGRWYLIAKDLSDEKEFVKIFGIDRMNAVDILNSTFDKENRSKATEMFNHCFGIFVPNAAKPTKVELSFYKSQKPYLETKPLHSSQKTISENDEEIIIQLTVFITYDFIRHLLSYGDEVEVIKPASLITQMKNIYKDTLKYYV